MSTKFDLIISSNVFEHVDDPLQAFNAVAKHAAGIIIIIVPNAHGLSTWLKRFRIYRKFIQHYLGNDRNIVYSIDGRWHNKSYTKETLKYLAKETGCEIIILKDIGNNDDIFGFVQPYVRSSYHIYEYIAATLRMGPQLLCITHKIE